MSVAFELGHRYIPMAQEATMRVPKITESAFPDGMRAEKHMLEQVGPATELAQTAADIPLVTEVPKRLLPEASVVLWSKAKDIYRRIVTPREVGPTATEPVEDPAHVGHFLLASDEFDLLTHKQRLIRTSV